MRNSCVLAVNNYRGPVELVWEYLSACTHGDFAAGTFAAYLHKQAAGFSSGFSAIVNKQLDSLAGVVARFATVSTTITTSITSFNKKGLL